MLLGRRGACGLGEDTVSFQKAETDSFRLKARNDVFDNLNEVIEYPRYGFAANDLDFIECYRHSDVDSVVRFRSLDESADFDLLFSAIPMRRHKQPNKATRPNNISETRPDIHSDETLMLSDVTCLVECPEEVIPSSVRLLRAKDRVNFFRDVLGSAFNLVLKFSGTIGKGESGVFQLAATRSERQSVSSAVEGGPKVVNCIMGAVSAELNGDRIIDPDFHNLMVRSLRIRLEKRSLFVSVPELFKFSVNISAVFLCARDLSA
jgi:hypothetical protein